MGFLRGQSGPGSGGTAAARGGGVIAYLYANENVALEIVEELRRLGHDALRSIEAGNANRRVPDDSVLAYAEEAGRILLTANRKDFIALHRAGAPHWGIVAYTERYDPISTAHRIHAALTDPLATGRFLARVDGVNHRFEP